MWRIWPTARTTQRRVFQLWHCRHLGPITLAVGTSLHCRMLSSTHGLPPLDANSIPSQPSPSCNAKTVHTKPNGPWEELPHLGSPGLQQHLACSKSSKSKSLETQLNLSEHPSSCFCPGAPPLKEFFKSCHTQKHRVVVPGTTYSSAASGTVTLSF